MCPIKFRLIDLFAANHWIEDTHALRMLDSRLGASISLSLPFIFAMIALSVFGEKNLLTTKGFQPMFDVDIPEKPEIFNHIYIKVESQAFVPSSFKKCDDEEHGIHLVKDESVAGSSSSLRCEKDGTTTLQRDDDLVSCGISFKCAVERSFAGEQDVQVKFPLSFQVVQWNIAPTPFLGHQMNLSHVLNPTHNNMLMGDESEPTVLTFSAQRGKLVNNFTSPKTEPIFGVLLTWSGLKRKQSSSTRTNPSDHVVAFRFSVVDIFYVREYSPKLELLVRCSTILTLLLSAMSILRIFKLFAEAGIDKLLIMRAKRKNEPAPEADPAQKIVAARPCSARR